MTTTPPGKPPAQSIDQALAERLQALRKALGLSVADMAHKLGLWGANGTDNLRQMERAARPLPGTLHVLIGYMERESQQLQPYQKHFLQEIESGQPVRFNADPRTLRSRPLPQLTHPGAKTEPDNFPD